MATKKTAKKRVEPDTRTVTLTIEEVAALMTASDLGFIQVGMRNSRAINADIVLDDLLRKMPKMVRGKWTHGFTDVVDSFRALSPSRDVWQAYAAKLFADRIIAAPKRSKRKAA